MARYDRVVIDHIFWVTSDLAAKFWNSFIDIGFDVFVPRVIAYIKMNQFFYQIYRY